MTAQPDFFADDQLAPSGSLIPITNPEGIPSVNARDLHFFLESKQEFSNWIKNRIESFGFVEGVDFTIDKIVIGRATQNDYAISLDMAKELSMVERNEKGKQARQFYIACEKKLREVKLAIPTHSEALRLAADSIEAKEAAEAALATKTLQLAAAVEREMAVVEELAEAAPKVAALDRIKNWDGMLNITNAAKNLQIRPSDLFDWLNQEDWIYRRPGSGEWVAYQESIKQGVLKHKVFGQHFDDGTERMRTQVMVTAKGLTKLAIEFFQP